MNTELLSDRDAPARLHAASQTFAKVRAALGAVIFGQDEVIEQSLVTLLAGGHGLLIGVPGLAKTKLVDTLGTVLGLDTSRVQFTPDLMPSDITRSEVMEESAGGTRGFRFIRGPVFTQLLMADEINRASPRTQSALLQAMQEKHVTVAGARHDLPQLFHVLATQNPLEQEGTYPLPEAQLEPLPAADRCRLSRPRGPNGRCCSPPRWGRRSGLPEYAGRRNCWTPSRWVRRVPVGEKVVEAILSLVRAARPDSDHSGVRSMIAWGPGPRASQALMLAARARALLDGRYAPSTDDVVALAGPVLRHRMALNFSARAEGATTAGVIGQLCRSLF